MITPFIPKEPKLSSCYCTGHEVQLPANTEGEFNLGDQADSYCGFGCHSVKETNLHLMVQTESAPNDQ